jgi:hypothetical protein
MTPLAHRRSIALALGMAAASMATPSGAASPARPAAPLDPISSLLDAARSRRVLALSEGQHWNEQGHRFRLALIRDPRFPDTFDDIVVESGSARYQEVMDKFIAGEPVADEQLRPAWRDTTQPNEVWDIPIYEEFFRAVRAVNLTRPKSRRVRVLLADPPIDWSLVKDKDDILRWMDQRDTHAANLVRTQVLAKGRRALLVFGDGHLFRHPAQPNVVSLLSRDAADAVFNVGAPTSADLTRVEPGVARWPVPSLALLEGTRLGAEPLGPYYDVRAGADVPPEVREQEWFKTPMERQFDALLYLGPPESITLAPVSREGCTDAAYMKMRLGRMALVPWGGQQIERLKDACAAAGARHVGEGPDLDQAGGFVLASAH